MSRNFPFVIFQGVPEPYGVSLHSKGKNFALFSEQAETVILCLFSSDSLIPQFEISLDPMIHKTGYVWHIMIQDLPDSFHYAYRIESEHPLNENEFLLDPYAKIVISSNQWGNQSPYIPLGSTQTEFEFDWQDDQPPRIPKKDLIIYEMHVRGFTQHESSQVFHKGTFLGLIEKIPHLLDLGVNAVELLPVHEFNENEYQILNPLTQQPLFNYWGYSTVNFFSLMNRYKSSRESNAAMVEFKMLVKELHRHGIEIILDVVFNHTSEGNERGPTYSFKGIDNSTYYLLDPSGEYSNYSGCGNTLNVNNPISINLIISSLRWYVTEFHIDGFRFDLASIFTRNQKGHPIQNSPLLEAITYDPILANTKLIAEAWDAVGLYQVGSFYPTSARWSEWNGKYRDCLRRFMKGIGNAKNLLATRICGSQDFFHQTTPNTSINYITSHDGFSLADLVSYNEKHNLENGENNQDGLNQNDSWNCGIEGPTDDPMILALRQRQMKNFHLALLISQGIPMLLMGDEYGHTRRGNNNCWCQDNELNWFLWDILKENHAFYRFYRGLIHFRNDHEILRQNSFLGKEDILWHGVTPLMPKWHDNIPFLAFTLIDKKEGEDLYLAFNANYEALHVSLPELDAYRKWYWIVNTANEAPLDFYEMPFPVNEPVFTLLPHSAVMMKAIKFNS